MKIFVEQTHVVPVDALLEEANAARVHVTLVKWNVLMEHIAVLCVLGCLLHAAAPCTFATSEFRLEGDYLIGGLFDIHHVSVPIFHKRPETLDCSR